MGGSRTVTRHRVPADPHVDLVCVAAADLQWDPQTRLRSAVVVDSSSIIEGETRCLETGLLRRPSLRRGRRDCAASRRFYVHNAATRIRCRVALSSIWSTPDKKRIVCTPEPLLGSWLVEIEGQIHRHRFKESGQPECLAHELRPSLKRGSFQSFLGERL